MSMNEVIRQKRKELDYTQKQIADQLDVSIPAVSKWESGATYPDVELLPALARVLKIDVNTLLCFKMELSEIEIGHLATKVSETARSEGIEKAFSVAEQVIHEYPTDVKLIHNLALTLQGTMMMVKVPDSMQELIDKLPEGSALDKKIMQANLWMNTGKEKEAEKIYASKTISGINQIMIPLTRLIAIAAKNGDTENASQLVEAGQTLIKAFGMWEFDTYIFAFEKSMAEENVMDTIKILDQMLEAMLIPWNTSDCPIYKHLGSDQKEMNLGEKMLPNILDELEKSETYDFLRKEEAFQQMIHKYRTLLWFEKK